ncbi:MAG: hypothetical protein KDE32_07375 [Novosphingobium sp.]|nr:hypothetical protein [Novosphingobium sp.]
MLLALSLAAAAPPAFAVPGGEIGTLPTGRYQCERQDDATGLVSIRIPEGDFRVRASSSYAAEGKRGSYLLTGDHMVMTSGPFEGRAFRRASYGSLREIGSSGEPGKVRCVLGMRVMP